MDNDQIFQLILVFILALYSGFVSYLEHKNTKEYFKKHKDDTCSNN